MRDCHCVPCEHTRPGECEIVYDVDCENCGEPHRRIAVVPIEHAPDMVREINTGIVQLRIAHESLGEMIKAFGQNKFEVVDLDEQGNIRETSGNA